MRKLSEQDHALIDAIKANRGDGKALHNAFVNATMHGSPALVERLQAVIHEHPHR